MAKLINGNGNPAVYAAQDADLIASICGDTTCIAAVGSEYAATQEDANTIGLADGVIITKEGRRIQLDAGYTDLFTIPTGTAGTTSYYIIGYKLKTESDSRQTCETFVQKMNSSSATIPEDTFRGGASEVYVSVYRVVQDGLNIQSINLLLPKLSNIGQLEINTSGSESAVLDNLLGDGTFGENVIYKQGKLININFRYNHTSSPIPDYSQGGFLIIPANYRPTTQVHALAFGYNTQWGNFQPVPLVITTDGTIKMAFGFDPSDVNMVFADINYETN